MIGNLQELVNSKIHALPHLEKFLRTYHLPIYKWVMDHTKFLDTKQGCKFTERVYCVLNGISYRLYDNFGGKYASFENYFEGYTFTHVPTMTQPRGKTKRRTDFNKKMYDYTILGYANLVGSTDPSHGVKIKRLFDRHWNRTKDNLNCLPKNLEGIEFVTCPILGLRMISLDKQYIESILLMTVDQFEIKHPEFIRISSRLSRNISATLNMEDKHGMKRSHKSVSARRKTMGKINPHTGLTKEQEKGLKTRNTHLTKVDDAGLNGYQRLAKYRNETICDNGNSIQKNALRSRYNNGKRSKFNRASKISKKFLAPIIEYLDGHSIPYYFDNNEFWVKNDRDMYFYDLVVPTLNLCVEFDGKSFHPNPYILTTNELWGNWRRAFTKHTADEIFMLDTHRSKVLYSQYGFVTWRVFEFNNEALVFEQVNRIVDHIKEVHVNIS